MKTFYMIEAVFGDGTSYTIPIQLETPEAAKRVAREWYGLPRPLTWYADPESRFPHRTWVAYPMVHGGPAEILVLEYPEEAEDGR